MFYDNDLKLIAEPGEFDVMIGGNPRDVKSATFIPKKKDAVMHSIGLCLHKPKC
jgi:hypothetical protein